MAITDELREYARHFSGIWYSGESNAFICTTGGIQPTTDSIRMDEHLLAIADRIDAEHEEYKGFCERLEEATKQREEVTLFGVDYTPLPVDADGKPIHIGDMLEEVDHDSRGSVGEMRLLGDGWWVIAGNIGRRPDNYRHHKPSTVEDMLCEMIDAVDDDRYGQDRIIAEYAAKLRLAGDAE